MDTNVYNVEISDGENAEQGANIITEIKYAQCDIECNHYRLIDQIGNHRKDNNVVSKDNKNVTDNGKRYNQMTTRG